MKRYTVGKVENFVRHRLPTKLRNDLRKLRITKSAFQNSLFRAVDAAGAMDAENAPTALVEIAALFPKAPTALSCGWRIVISPMIPQDSPSCNHSAMRNLVPFQRTAALHFERIICRQGSDHPLDWRVTPAVAHSHRFFTVPTRPVLLDSRGCLSFV
jgi:hypothetical protein